jgi:hypothetical protein
MTASREELALAEQLAATAMPPGTRVWHEQYGEGFVSAHYGDLTLAYFSGRSRCMRQAELKLADEPEETPSTTWEDDPARWKKWQAEHPEAAEPETGLPAWLKP